MARLKSKPTLAHAQPLQAGWTYRAVRQAYNTPSGIGLQRSNTWPDLTRSNRRGIIQGHIDTHLNDHGRTEAGAAGRGLKKVRFDEIWSSSLSRAHETAQIIQSLNTASDPTEIKTDAGLKERYLGGLQGKTRGYGQPLPDDVEPTEDFRKRIATWLTAFLSTHLPLPATSEPSQPTSEPVPATSEETERTALVVSHGAYMKALLFVLLSPQFGFEVKEGVDIKEQCWNTSIMRVRVRVDERTGRWKGKVLCWGDVRHLEEEGEWEDVGVADDV